MRLNPSARITEGSESFAVGMHGAQALSGGRKANRKSGGSDKKTVG